MAESPILRRDVAFPSRERTPELIFKVFRAEAYWKWCLVDGENSIIAESSKVYRTQEDCEQAIKIIKLKILKAGTKIE
jgi:uncharacterized protein YegP (UPF0339 family)